MAGRRSDPRWRDAAAAGLAARWISTALSPDRALVVGDRLGVVPEALAAGGGEVRSWGRRLGEGVEVGVAPPEGLFDLVALRMPRSRSELAMLAHQVAARTAPQGRLLLYGARDEGIGSAASTIEPPFAHGESVAVGGRCRLVLLHVNSRAAPDPRLEAWAQPVEAGVVGPDGPGWITYPGVFGGPRVDPGTALLLDHLEPSPHRATVLDFGCGWGVIGATLLALRPKLRLTLLDIDALALEAARRNVPGASVVLGDGLEAVPGRFDRIVANPPYHRGKGETLSVVESLVRGAPAKLLPGGRLTLVVQRRFDAGALLRGAFAPAGVRVLAEDRIYRVWEARC